MKKINLLLFSCCFILLLQAANAMEDPNCNDDTSNLKKKIQQERCNKCESEKRMARMVYIDPNGEESPIWMKLCKKCEENIKEYIKDKQIEDWIGYKTSLPILEQMQNQKFLPPKVVETPEPKVPPGCQLPTKQQINRTINHQMQ